MSLEQDKEGRGDSDPTMEDILASIRRIIAEDSEPNPDAKPVVTDGIPPGSEPEPEPEPVVDAPKKRNVLELTEMVADDGSVVSLPGRNDSLEDEVEEDASVAAADSSSSEGEGDDVAPLAETTASPPAINEDDALADFPVSGQDDELAQVESDGFATIDENSLPEIDGGDDFAAIDENSLPEIDGGDDFPQIKADDDFFGTSVEEVPSVSISPSMEAEPAPNAVEEPDFDTPLPEELELEELEPEELEPEELEPEELELMSEPVADDDSEAGNNSFPDFEIGEMDMALEPEVDPMPDLELEPETVPEPMASVPTPPTPSPVAPAKSGQDVRSDMMEEHLTSESAVVSTRNAFNQVAQAMQAEQVVRSSSSPSNNSRTIDQMAEELLTPMLKEWLNANLAPLVEQLVSKEIARIAGRDTSSP